MWEAGLTLLRTCLSSTYLGTSLLPQADRVCSGLVGDGGGGFRQRLLAMGLLLEQGVVALGMDLAQEHHWYLEGAAVFKEP